MNYTVTVIDSDIQFECADGSTILDAARAAGWELPHSCRRGVCLNCAGCVIAGELKGAAPSKGDVLFCQAKPSSDLLIKPGSITRIDSSARKVVNVKVFRLERLTADVVYLHLRFPTGTRGRFKAGQYLEIILNNGERRSFSMANEPQFNDGIELHIRLVPGGYFSEQVVPTLETGKVLQVELPFGDFTFRGESQEPAVFVASGTGYAPIRSLILDAFRKKLPRPMTLYWGGRRREDLYMLQEPSLWQDKHAGFRFVPVLSEPDGAGVWSGRIGLVHRAVMDDFVSLAGHHVYACGVPAMVTAARADFLSARALPPSAFFSDVFVTTHPERPSP
jgi:NAD(P)H-flavin reductase/ferredoxin